MCLVICLTIIETPEYREFQVCDICKLFFQVHPENISVQFKFHPDVPFYNISCWNDLNNIQAMRIMEEYFECVLPVGDGNIKIRPPSTIPTLKSVYMYIQQESRIEKCLLNETNLTDGLVQLEVEYY